MQMSEKWRRESVNQQIPFVYPFPGYCYCYGYYYQKTTTFGYSSKKIWRATTLPVDLAAFKKERNRVMNLMSEARLVKYNQFIEDNSTDRRRLFVASKSLMNMKKDRSPPPHSDVSLLANDMGQFFYCQDYQYQVKAGRHSSITSSAVNARAQPGIWIWWYCIFRLPMPNDWESSSYDYIWKEKILHLGPNTCLLIICRFRLTLSCHYLCGQPVLADWIFCWHLENCCGIPIIKKARPRSTVQEFRPISKLQCASKLTELVVASQIHCHITKNNLFPQLQSAYRSHHSTKDNEWSIREYVQGPCITLIYYCWIGVPPSTLLILLQSLQTKLGVCRTALSWFKSNLEGKSQITVCIKETYAAVWIKMECPSRFMSRAAFV